MSNNNSEKYNIGYVSKVSGISITVKVYENKNSNILVIGGDIIPNVSVKRYVKIPYEYNYIIGIVEGERIEENKYYKEEYGKDNEKIDRYLDIKILGELRNNKFISGIVNLPLVFSEVYLLNTEEKNAIHNIAGKESIELGHILNDSQEKFKIDTNFLASHIGIFGNTGSGKSNTLAKIYTEVFNNYNVENSKFIFFDFNGEYEPCFNNKNLVDYQKNKITLDKDIFSNFDIMSIISSASDKTQKPFLYKVIENYKKFDNNNEIKYDKQTILNLLYSIFDRKSILYNNLNLLCEFFKEFCNIEDFYIKKYLGTLNLVKNDEKFNFKINNQQIADDFYIKINNKLNKDLSSKNYINNYDEYQEYINSYFRDKIKIKEKLSNSNKFIYILKYLYFVEIINGYIKEEHVSPIIGRLKNTLKKFNEKIEINEKYQYKNIIIFSLNHFDLDLKKLLPLILSKYFYDIQKKKFNSENKSSLHIIVDEAHNILSQNSNRESDIIKDYRLETFEEIIKEGRKFGTFLTISSQRPSDISSTIISQLHNYFIHRLVNDEDLKLIQKNISFLDKSSNENIPVLPPGACVYTGVNANFPLLVQIEKLEENKSPESKTVDLIELWSN